MRYYNLCTYDRNENLLKNTVIEVTDDGVISDICQNADFQPTSEDYDCQGLVGIAGFMDSAVTLPGVDIFKLAGVDISAMNSVDDYLYLLATVTAPNGIRGYGYNTFVVGEDGAGKIKRLLDMRFPSKPSYVFADDMTTVIVNEFILEKAKEFITIDRDTHSDGELDIFEMSILKRNTDFFDFSPDEVRLALMSFQGEMIRNGIVAVRIIDTFGDLSTLRVLKELNEKGLWKLTTILSAPMFAFDTLDEMWKRYSDYREFEGGDIYVIGVSMTLDGSIDTGQAALFEPYEVDKAWYGDILWNTDKLRMCVKDFLTHGIDVNINATGDKAVSLAADVLSTSIREGEYTDGRRTITHAYLMSDLDIATCARYRIYVCVEPNMVPYHNSFYEGDRIMLGERIYMEYPIGRLISEGVKIIAGSNTPMNQDVSPIAGVYRAAHRVSADDATPYQVMRAYRETPLALFGLFNELGTIAVGKRASIVLLNKDIINLREDLFCDCEIMATIVDGVVMWESEKEIKMRLRV